MGKHTYSSTFAAPHLQRTAGSRQGLACNALLHVPKLGTAVTHRVNHIGDKVTHITGLPNVPLPLPLKPDHPPLEPLYDAATCIGGLVDT